MPFWFTLVSKLIVHSIPCVFRSIAATGSMEITDSSRKSTTYTKSKLSEQPLHQNQVISQYSWEYGTNNWGKSLIILLLQVCCCKSRQNPICYAILLNVKIWIWFLQVGKHYIASIADTTTGVFCTKHSTIFFYRLHPLLSKSHIW